MEDIRFEILPAAGIDLIRPLWEKLNEIHYRQSPYFADEYKAFSFEKRKEKLFGGGRTGWQIEIAHVALAVDAVAYCFTSINRDLEGEIDSLYVEPAFRRFRVADTLMRHALHWLAERGAVSKRVAVAAGNEQALPFYEFYHFYPRYVMLLERKP
jgi:GNAT superfamily N-acetyltransferase